MANENEKYELQDEGEYQFSDEQTEYEADAETKVAPTAVVQGSSPLAGLNRYRRILIASGVFVVLMFIVYKTLTPSTTTPTAEISQAPTAPAVLKPPVVETATAKPPIVATVPQPPAIIMPPAASSAPPPPQIATAAEANKELLDRVASLEQQNAKLSNVLQIEYAQKLADYNNQFATTQAKLRDLNTRLMNMEATLTQLTQVMQGTNKQISMSPGMPATKVVGPRQTYTVQAIIPGRAWLKSDAGDTVTVAEGDVLRDFGRVTKIDPYDGVVDIDTGNKMVSLSYGTSGD